VTTTIPSVILSPVSTPQPNIRKRSLLMTVLSAITHEPLVPESQRSSFPILFLHGYEIYADGRLSPLSQAVCDTAIRLLEMNGDLRVIILGGWHLKEVNSSMLIADAMRFNLISRGISLERIITKAHFRSLDSCMPPRDTWEEFMLLLQILKRLGRSPNTPLQSVAWDFHIPRLKRMLKTYRLTDTEIVPAVPEPHEGLRRRKWMERCARVVRFIDPDGDGIICHSIRLGRTLNENLKPIIA